MNRHRPAAFSAVVGAALIVLALVPTIASGATAFPATIGLPDGWQPEGIAVGRGHTFYAGSLAGGAIYQGDLRTGEGGILVPARPDAVVAGLFVDPRSDFIFAAGALTGQGLVFAAGDGTQLATYQLAPPGATFVNDVVVTREAAYFTDSFQPVVYRVPLGPRGGLPDPADVLAVPLGDDFVFVPGGFNANGIEATPDGRWLLLVNSTTGALYRVDPTTGDATAVDLGGATLVNGDGLRLRGSTLYVVQNRLNQIAVVELASDYAAGEVADFLVSPGFDIPTTVAAFGSALYAVNARFGIPPAPDTEYWITRVPVNR